MKFRQRLIRKIGLLLNLNAVGIYQRKWVKDGGDSLLRYNFVLPNPDIIVFDLGAFNGEFIDNIHNKFQTATIYAFETNINQVEFLSAKYKHKPSVIVNEFGLGSDEISGLVVGSGPGSKLVPSEHGSILIKKFSEYIDAHDIKNIDVLKINIEGPEYELVEHIINSNMISRINYLQIQFHDFVDESLVKLLMMHRLLSKTHALEFSYPFVWDQWKRL